MDRFVAFSWDDRSTFLTQRVAVLAEHLLSADPGWSTAFHAPGLTIFQKAKSSAKHFLTLMSAATGAIVGPLFRRGDEASGVPTRLGEQDTSQIVATAGGALLRDFWGSYIAIWRSDAGTVDVLRDPSGAQPCFHTLCAGVDILCSAVADIAGLPGVHFSIDEQFVAASLARNSAITRHTGLAELSEVLPGERVTLQRSQPARTMSAWCAAEHARSVREQPFADAVAEAREVTERCLAAWARLADRIVVRLSGGLDSSTVAALAYRHAARPVTALHLIGKDYEAHELMLARKTAQRLGIELLEIDERSQQTDYGALLANEPVTARPTRQIFGAPTDSLLSGVHARTGADTVLSGHGGDVIFFQRSMSGLISADDLQLNGPTPAFWSRCYDSAVLLERSIWGVMSDAFTANLRRRTSRRSAATASTPSDRVTLLDGQLKKISQTYLQHPQSALLAGLPPAKAAHVAGLHALRDYHAQRGSSLLVNDRHPLMSQPIIEFALATPTYLFGAGGVDRSLERHAFRDLLPDEIYRRTSKGFVTHALGVLFAQNMPWFREILLDGDLVRLLDMDRRKVESILTLDHLQLERGLADLMNLVATEVWLSSWKHMRRLPG